MHPCPRVAGVYHDIGERNSVGWAKALFASCPPWKSAGAAPGLVGTPSGAHSRDPLALPTLRLNRTSRRIPVRGDDLVGGAAGHFGHAVELPGEAAGAGGSRT